MRGCGAQQAFHGPKVCCRKVGTVGDRPSYPEKHTRLTSHTDLKQKQSWNGRRP